MKYQGAICILDAEDLELTPKDYFAEMYAPEINNSLMFYTDCWFGRDNDIEPIIDYDDLSFDIKKKYFDNFTDAVTDFFNRCEDINYHFAEKIKKHSNTTKEFSSFWLKQQNFPEKNISLDSLEDKIIKVNNREKLSQKEISSKEIDHEITSLLDR